MFLHDSPSPPGSKPDSMGRHERELACLRRLHVGLVGFDPHRGPVERPHGCRFWVTRSIHDWSVTAVQ